MLSKNQEDPTGRTPGIGETLQGYSLTPKMVNHLLVFSPNLQLFLSFSLSTKIHSIDANETDPNLIIGFDEA
jgi:hypothetical protein